MHYHFHSKPGSLFEFSGRVIGALKTADVAVKTKVGFQFRFYWQWYSRNLYLALQRWVEPKCPQRYLYLSPCGPYSSSLWRAQSLDLREFPFLWCSVLHSRTLSSVLFPDTWRAFCHDQHSKDFEICKSDIVFCQITAVATWKVQTLGQCTSQKMQ